jgi:hypothetical protein
MADLNLPDDLFAFLQNGKQLEYDPATCEAGAITFLPVDRLRIEFFPMISESPEDPHAGESGCYLVKGVSLIASCDNYDPTGLLLWLPLDERYGLWDGEHGTLFVFGPDVDWSEIARDLPRHINAEWSVEGSAAVTDLIPWPRHSYNPEQVCHPLPDLAEWYEAKWVRRGEYRNGVQLRFPEEIRIRVECASDRCELTAQSKKAEGAASWSSPASRLLMPDEWQGIQSWLAAGFWNQPSMAAVDHQVETATMWSFSGYRASRYHRLFRSYDENSSEGDAVHELGKHLARLAHLHPFGGDS